MTWALLRPKTAAGTVSGGDGTEKGETSPDPTHSHPGLESAESALSTARSGGEQTADSLAPAGHRGPAKELQLLFRTLGRTIFLQKQMLRRREHGPMEVRFHWAEQIQSKRQW